jgi:mycothiol synthase
MDNRLLPSDLRWRVATRADVGAITALVAACEVAADGAAGIHPNDILQVFDLAGEDRDVVVVEEPGRIVAWGGFHGERAEVDVEPGRRGRGIGTAVLAWSEARARDAGAARVRQTKTHGDGAARSLFQRHGYAQAHTSWILEMPLGRGRPGVVLPAGIQIRPYAPSDAAAVYRVVEDAFSEWPGRRPTPFEAWSRMILDHASFSPGLSRLAVEGEEVVGVALAQDYDGDAEGWVQQLATKATHRNRGIARALLQSTFAAFHDTGRRQVGLSTDSRTGALTLYEHLGMRIRRSYTSWVKELG